MVSELCHPVTANKANITYYVQGYGLVSAKLYNASSKSPRGCFIPSISCIT